MGHQINCQPKDTVANTKTYLPTREADLLDWCQSFYRNLASDPTVFGLQEADVADYKAMLDAFAQSHATASDPATRTGPAIERKDADKSALRRLSQSVVRQIQARPQTTDEQRRLLDITVPDRKPTPHPAPSGMPDVQVVMAVRHTISLKIRREDGGRGRPVGTIGANVYYAVSPTVPTTSAGWTHAGQATRMGHQIALPESTPAGATVWIAANWYNGRGETGPLSDAVTTNLPGGQSRLVA